MPSDAELRKLVSELRDQWSRYQRDDLSREEFEGFIAELAEKQLESLLASPEPDLLYIGDTRSELERLQGDLHAVSDGLSFEHSDRSLDEASRALRDAGAKIASLLACNHDPERPEGVCGCCNRCWVEGAWHEREKQDAVRATSEKDPEQAARERLVPTADEVGSLSIIAWDPEFQTRSRWIVGVEFLKRFCRYYQCNPPEPPKPAPGCWRLVRLDHDWAHEAYVSDGTREVCGKGQNVVAAINAALGAAERSRT